MNRKKPSSAGRTGCGPPVVAMLLAAIGLLLAACPAAEAPPWGTARIKHDEFGYKGIAGVWWDYDNDGT